MAPTAAAVGRVVALCKSPDIELRRSALQALAHAGPHIALARPALLHALADPEPRIRLVAADTLAQIKLTEDCIAPLQAALSDTVWTVRWRAVRALARLGAFDKAEAALCETLPGSGVAHEWELAVRTLPDLSTELAALLWRYNQDLQEGRRA
jgi:HEAT repeat protein